MEFSEAADMMKVKNPVGADELGDMLAQHHAASPQRETLARSAVAQIREGLAKLASLGHQFHLVEHDPSRAAAVQFPKMMYKEGVGKVVENSSDEASAREEGFV